VSARPLPPEVARFTRASILTASRLYAVSKQFGRDSSSGIKSTQNLSLFARAPIAPGTSVLHRIVPLYIRSESRRKRAHVRYTFHSEQRISARQQDIRSERSMDKRESFKNTPGPSVIGVPCPS
jgi:hypothetical protein